MSSDCDWSVQVQKMDGEILFTTSMNSLEAVFGFLIDVVDTINSLYRVRETCCRIVVRQFAAETHRVAYEHSFVACLYPSTCA